MSRRQVFPYISAQIIGALLASAVLRGLFPQHTTLSATLPSGSAMQSFVLEIILTALLMLVIPLRIHGRGRGLPRALPSAV